MLHLLHGMHEKTSRVCAVAESSRLSVLRMQTTAPRLLTRSRVRVPLLCSLSRDNIRSWKQRSSANSSPTLNTDNHMRYSANIATIHEVLKHHPTLAPNNSARLLAQGEKTFRSHYAVPASAHEQDAKVVIPDCIGRWFSN